MANQVYFEGDWWQCNEATTAGQSPSTHPSKWSKQVIPGRFREFLIRRAYAHVLETEGQTDKARATHKDAQSVLEETITAARAHNERNRRPRTNVMVR